MPLACEPGVGEGGVGKPGRERGPHTVVLGKHKHTHSRLAIFGLAVAIAWAELQQGLWKASLTRRGRDFPRVPEVWIR